MDLRERRRRVQWLRALEADPEGLVRLCGRSGLARAAWHIALARCGSDPAQGPSREALRSVAHELSVRVQYFDVPPGDSWLDEELMRWGLAVAA